MKKNFNTVLVTTDFSEKSLIALEESFNLARLTGLNITLFHVIRDSGHSLFSMFDGEKSSAVVKEYEDRFRAELVKIANDAAKRSGITINPVISSGKEYDKILKASELLESKFIVMGLNSEPIEADKRMIGSVSGRVIRRAKCPVITVNNSHTYDGCRSILLPLDLTADTRQKVSNAIEIARIFDSRIKIISVLISQEDKTIASQLKQQLKQAEKVIRESGIECSAELIPKKPEHKSPACCILDYAEQQGDVDLIMIMTQQESGLFEFFIGSSAQEIIRRSKVPVMSIIPKQLGFITFTH
jgi:nucleotide-binding universal stress UspA family protein